MPNPNKISSLTQISSGQITIAGHDIDLLIREFSFSQVSWLLLTGQFPDQKQARMLEAMLVSCVDHGINAPSTSVARAVASCGVPIQSAISAGIAAIGEHHGGAGEACARILQKAIKEHPTTATEDIAQMIVLEYSGNNKRIPGFGHRVHTSDPRTISLFRLARELDLVGQHVNLILAIESILCEAKGKKIPINVDGAIAAILLDLGLDWHLSKSIFIISRTVGLSAHVNEEMMAGKPLEAFRRLGRESSTE